MSQPGNASSREIERKFLIKCLPDQLARFRHDEIEQGYLAIEDGIQVRLRKKGSTHSLTFKRGDGRSREEREITLTSEQFTVLWPATARRRLTKTRYDIPWQGHTIEIDIYHGRHDGLIVAEVEFQDEKSCASFEPPDWIGRDVSGEARYSNVALALA